MSNEYFQPGSVPTPNAPGSSAIIRGEFTSVAAAFDKLPVMAGNGGEIVAINGTGTGLLASGILISTLVTTAGAQTLTNKTLAWGDNTYPGFGTAATKNAGTGVGDVPTLSAEATLPTLNGSNLTNLNVNQSGTIVGIAYGGTGENTLSGVQGALGIDLKADANNAVLTGAPVAPTPPVGDNSPRVATTAFVVDTVTSIGAFAPSNATPLINGVAAPGVGVLGARDDHVHPTDTSLAPIASPVFTGDPKAPTPTPGDNDTSIATTAFVNAEIAADRPYSNTNPLINGAAAQGVSANISRQDHVHPTDTSRAPIASPVFTGDPKAPTPLTSDNDTSIATTAFVQSLLAQQPAAGMQPSNATPLINGAATPGTGVDGSRYDHVHPTDTSRAPIASPVFTGDASFGAGTPVKPAGCSRFVAIGDADSGVGQMSDGRIAIYGNGVARFIFEANGNLTAASGSGETDFYIGPQTNGGYLFGNADNIGLYSPTTGASVQVSKNPATKVITLDSGSNVGGKVGLVGQQTALFSSADYAGYRVRSFTASGSVTKYGFVDFSNEVDVATSSIIAAHNTNGSGDIIFSPTPPGSRTADRRYTGLKLNGSSGFAELSMPLSLDYTGSNATTIIRNTASNGVQLSLQSNGVNGNRTLRLLDGTFDLVNHAYSAQTFIVTDTYIGTNTIRPMIDNVSSCGAAGFRYSTVYAASGTINTSDAREKTAVRALTNAEIEAAKQLGKEIGAYQWLASIAEKGKVGAREHIGLTVQRAIEILEANGLVAFNYGFICFDQWHASHQEWPAIETVEYQEATYDEEGNELTQEVRAVEGRAAFTQTLAEEGDRYSFRYDELNLFIARGFEARLSALEAATL